jgi:hypothetical protein
VCPRLGVFLVTFNLEAQGAPASRVNPVTLCLSAKVVPAFRVTLRQWARDVPAFFRVFHVTHRQGARGVPASRGREGVGVHDERR